MHERELAVSGGFEWASQLRHFKRGNYPSWEILAHASVEITGNCKLCLPLSVFNNQTSGGKPTTGTRDETQPNEAERRVRVESATLNSDPEHDKCNRNSHIRTLVVMEPRI